MSLNTRLPEVITINGEVTTVKSMSAEAYGKFSTDMLLVSITSVDDKVIELWITQSMFDAYEFKSIIFVGNIVTITCNDNIANETHYIDQDGEEQEHEHSWFEVVNAYHCATMTMAKHLIPEFLINSVIKMRETISTTIKPIVKFHAGKDTDAETLIAKYNKSTNPIYKGGIGTQLGILGYAFDITNNMWYKL